MVAQKRHICSTDCMVDELASLWGVRRSYRDAGGRWRESPRETVTEVVSALAGDTPSGPWSAARTGPERERWLRVALAARRAQLRDRFVEPVLVAWDGMLVCDSLRRAQSTLCLEDGSQHSLEPTGSRGAPTAGQLRLAGPRLSGIPFGYHRLRIEGDRQAVEATIISAPRRCWAEDGDTPSWGVFTPLYALRSERDWGAGDLKEMEALLSTVSDAGGRDVATLPMLSAYLDVPFEPAPYSPVSRLFWNEFYLAVDGISEWAVCPEARAVWQSYATQDRLQILRSSPLVDYAGVMSEKRSVLAELSRCFFANAGSARRAQLASFLREKPEVLEYADFRARVERHGGDWRDWPASDESRGSPICELEGLCEVGRYHVYVQWQMEEQLSRVSGSGRWSPAKADHAVSAPRAGLFLDLPVGVHPGGFDTWRYRDLFIDGLSIGAPPDAFFSQGQRWDSPPPHPERMRLQGQAYWRAILKNHMRFASKLRIDHVMALHRLFWIPEGRDPLEGVYVDYPADELYAVLCLESHRHQTQVVGEDLGTVPAGVRSRMRRHGVLGIWVLQGSLKPRAKRVISPPSQAALAALGTHDMFPLAGFLCGRDIQAREETGQIDSASASRARSARRRLVVRLSQCLTGDPSPDDPADLLAGLLSYLAASEAAYVLVNLDDLVLQPDPHNIPGTGTERGNWRRKMESGLGPIEKAIAWAATRLAGPIPGNHRSHR